DLDGNPVCVAQAGQYAYVVGELNLRFDQAGGLLSCQGRPHILIGDDFERMQDAGNALTRDERRAIKADVARSGALRITQPDPAAVAVLAPHRARKQAYGSTVVTHADETLCAR